MHHAHLRGTEEDRSRLEQLFSARRGEGWSGTLAEGKDEHDGTGGGDGNTTDGISTASGRGECKVDTWCTIGSCGNLMSANRHVLP